jgi:lipopolysaccharide export LptBFGC system permease protein LptF
MERSDVVEIGIAVGSVGLFVAALGAVGTMYGTGGSIAADGALPLVGALVLFVLVMAAAGLYLSRQDS